jgi:threonine/homoserine/homoserine lactone efflux protein
MEPGSILLFMVATLAVCLAPGPNVLLVFATGLRAGPRAVTATVAGVVLASSVFLAIAALGLAAALAALPGAFTGLRLAGAAYLVWVGAQTLRAATAQARRAAVIEIVDPPQTALTAPFIKGLVTHLANPKAILFWAALLPQFIRADEPPTSQIMRLGGIAIALDVIVLMGYGLVAARLRGGLAGTAFSRWVDVVAGAMLALCGVLLALTA